MLISAIVDEKGTEVAAVAPDTPVAEAVRLLAARRIGAVLVRDGAGEVRGILSERDLVRALAADGAAALARTAADLMTSPVRCCAPDDTVEQVMAAMTEGRFRHMPVMVDGALAGIVSIGDVVKHRLEEAGQEVNVLRGYIAGAA